ncbi:MAG: hypothetical protein R3E83_16480 [Burkholderiaceae bacterium]
MISVRFRRALFSVMGVTLISACGGGSSGTEATSTTGDPATPVAADTAAKGEVVTGFSGEPGFALAGSATSLGAGADGQGGVAIAGRYRVRGARVTVFDESGLEIGSAVTDANGLVTFRPAAGSTAPVLVQMAGSESADIYDPLLDAVVPFAAGTVWRAFVPRVASSIVISPLTEAVVARLDRLSSQPAAEAARRAKDVPVVDFGRLHVDAERPLRREKARSHRAGALIFHRLPPLRLPSDDGPRTIGINLATPPRTWTTPADEAVDDTVELDWAFYEEHARSLFSARDGGSAPGATSPGLTEVALALARDFESDGEINGWPRSRQWAFDGMAAFDDAAKLASISQWLQDRLGLIRQDPGPDISTINAAVVSNGQSFLVEQRIGGEIFSATLQPDASLSAPLRLFERARLHPLNGRNAILSAASGGSRPNLGRGPFLIGANDNGFVDWAAPVDLAGLQAFDLGRGFPNQSPPTDLLSAHLNGNQLLLVDLARNVYLGGAAEGLLAVQQQLGADPAAGLIRLNGRALGLNQAGGFVPESVSSAVFWGSDRIFLTDADRGCIYDSATRLCTHPGGEATQWRLAASPEIGVLAFSTTAAYRASPPSVVAAANGGTPPQFSRVGFDPDSTKPGSLAVGSVYVRGQSAYALVHRSPGDGDPTGRAGILQLSDTAVAAGDRAAQIHSSAGFLSIQSLPFTPDRVVLGEALPSGDSAATEISYRFGLIEGATPRWQIPRPVRFQFPVRF